MSTKTTTPTRAMLTASQSTQSVWIVCAITILALLIGSGLKSIVENQTRPLERSGVTAQVPAGWIIEKGIEGEQTLFIARDPFGGSLRYTASLVPTATDMKPSDLAFTFNLQRGQEVTLFRTLDQNQEKLNGKDVLRVHYAFVDPQNQTSLPLVIEGVEYIFMSYPNALIVAMEDETSQFQSALPSFKAFVSRMQVAAGGNQ